MLILILSLWVIYHDWFFVFTATIKTTNKNAEIELIVIFTLTATLKHCWRLGFIRDQE